MANKKSEETYLLVMRHGKSSWKHDLEDKQRPLKKRGRSDSKDMAEFLLQRRFEPDMILCSDATRALETLQHMQSKFSRQSMKIVVTPDLYGHDAASVSNVIESVKHAVPHGGHLARKKSAKMFRSRCVLMIGHNPAFEELVFELTGKNVTLPTAAVAVLKIKTDRWELLDVFRPKEVLSRYMGS